MDSHTIFADLRNILAYLYPDEASSRTVVADAGLDARRIQFSDRAIDNWHAILNEAVNSNRMDALLGVVQKAYGESQDFREVCDSYHGFVDAGDEFESLPELERNDFFGHRKSIAIGISAGFIVLLVASYFFFPYFTQSIQSGSEQDNIPHENVAVGGEGPVIQDVEGDVNSINNLTPAPTETPIVTPTPTPFPTITPTPLPFAPANEDEFLIVIAAFHHTEATKNVEIHNEIRRAIGNAIDKSAPDFMRVEVDSNSIATHSWEEAIKLGHQ